MPSGTPSASQDETWAAVTARYSGLAKAAQAGQQITDWGSDALEAGCFGATGYDDTSELPDGAVRASLGCGNPVAVAKLNPGETVLDLGSGGGIDVLLSARRVAPDGRVYGRSFPRAPRPLRRARPAGGMPSPSTVPSSPSGKLGPASAPGPAGR
jgi:hypothetical protein